MKNFWILTLFLLMGLLKNKDLFSQSDTLRLYQCYHSFSNEEKAEWTAFENNWNYFDYSDLKKKCKVKKLNCNSCESLYAELYVIIDDQGKVTVAEFLKGKKCGIECEEKDFINWFEASLRKQNFRSIKNKQFIARFGHVLKC